MNRSSLWISIGLWGILGSAYAAANEAPQIARINALVQQQWEDYGLRPSGKANEGEWCRRVYLDLLGRIPSFQELRAFRRHPSKDKKQKLVQQLLYGDQHVMSYARNWSTIWTNLLIGRSGGTERDSLTDRAGLQKYLRDAFAVNRSYDRMVSQLLTAKGDTKPGTKDFNGAVNFLITKLEDDAVQATSRTARIFLGKQVQCTQCHNHPFNDWKQNQFWELNAFFRQAVSLRRYVPGTREVSHAELADQDFAGEGSPPTVEEAEVYFEPRNASLVAAYPVFIHGEELQNRSGLIADVDRRKELAKLVLASEEMPRAMVNRMWAHFLGYGFTQPVDDMGPHNPPTHPQLLDYLAAEFVKHNYDLKQLMQWIVLSRPYGLSSRITKRNEADDPTKGETPKFSHFYLRQMRAEELYESLLVATRVVKTVENRTKHDRQKQEWLKQFVVAFGNDEGGEATTFDGSIPQALMLFNGEMIKQALKRSPNAMLVRLAQNRQPLTRKVDYLFQSALSRRPTSGEQWAAKQLVEAKPDDPVAGMQDLWWAILNSNEFILNH